MYVLYVLRTHIRIRSKPIQSEKPIQISISRQINSNQQTDIKMPSKPHPRSLLLTFDALDTLYRPRGSIAAQYLSAAREHKLPLRNDVTVDTVSRAFKIAYEKRNRIQPIYGHKIALHGGGGNGGDARGGPAVWWANVIRDSFQQVMATGSDKVPDALVRDLYERFESAKGYELFDDVRPFFALMRRIKKAFAEQHSGGGGGGRTKSSPPSTASPRIVVGVISNSDNRIDQVLRALGLQVPRIGTSVETGEQWDIDHIVTSYEAGCEKPDPAIFHLAYEKVVASQHAPGVSKPKQQQRDKWHLMHVGDHLQKDCKGAIEAGWDSSLLLDRDGLAGALHWDDPKISRVRLLEDVVERLKEKSLV